VFIPGGGSAGIHLGTGNQGWTITNNRFYQTATKTQTTAGTHNDILITNTGNTAGGYTITGNVFGYGANNRTGTSTFAGTVTVTYTAISFTEATTGAASTISNNLISDISYTGTGTATSFTGITMVRLHQAIPLHLTKTLLEILI